MFLGSRRPFLKWLTDNDPDVGPIACYPGAKRPTPVPWRGSNDWILNADVPLDILRQDLEAGRLISFRFFWFLTSSGNLPSQSTEL
jgi:hypothetical protein